MNIFLPIIALTLPFIALAIQTRLAFSYLSEEILKAGLVYFIDEETETKHKLIISFLIGLFFAVTESFIYSTSILMAGGVGLFFQRLLFTSLLHASTTLVMGVFLFKKKRFFLFGVALAMLIHYFYNTQIPF